MLAPVTLAVTPRPASTSPCLIGNVPSLRLPSCRTSRSLTQAAPDPCPLLPPTGCLPTALSLPKLEDSSLAAGPGKSSKTTAAPDPPHHREPGMRSMTMPTVCSNILQQQYR